MSASELKKSIDVVTAATQFMNEQLDKYEGARKDVLRTVSTQNNSRALLMTGRGLLWGSLLVIAVLALAVWVNTMADDKKQAAAAKDVSGNSPIRDVASGARSARLVARALVMLGFVLAAVLITVFFVTSYFAQSDVANMSKFVTFKLGDILYRAFSDAPDRMPTEVREARRKSSGGAASELSDDRKAMLRNYMSLAFSSNDFGSNLTDFMKIYKTAEIPHRVHAAEKARRSLSFMLIGASVVLGGSAAFAAFYDDRDAQDAAQRQLKKVSERLVASTDPDVAKVLRDEWNAREDVVAKETSIVKVSVMASLGGAALFFVMMAMLYYRYYRVLYKTVPRMYSEASDAWGVIIDTMRELDKRGKNPLAPGSTMIRPSTSSGAPTSGSGAYGYPGYMPSPSAAAALGSDYGRALAAATGLGLGRR